MAAYITKKTSWIRFLLSIVPAAGVAAFLCLLLEGPRLGPFYDFLLRRRPAPPVSGELLIIEIPGQELGEDLLEPGAASSLLYTMTEMGARTLIIQVPVLGLSAGGTTEEAEILYRFDEEFSILSRNIRNLFDAIRTGSVAPRDSARYVGELVDLSEKGKERLVSALVHRDAEGIIKMERAAAFFGHVRRPDDLRVQLIRAAEGPVEPDGSAGVLAGYSRARRDMDGTLRRIAPELVILNLSDGEAGERTLEHIIFGAMKTRFSYLEIEETEPDVKLAGLKSGLSLVGRGDGTDLTIPLDRNGELLFEVPRKETDFRRIDISNFLVYDEEDRNLRRLLAEGESLGIFRSIDGERRPDLLYDFALSLREEFSSSPAGETEKKQIWIEARNRYFDSLHDFISGPAGVNLTRAYEEIAAAEASEDQKPPEATGDILSFAAIKARYEEVLELREKLGAALGSSFCILGRGSAQANRSAGSASAESLLLKLWNFPLAVAQDIKSLFIWPDLTDVEASALLANSILTGRGIKPGPDLYLLICSLVSGLLACFFVKSLGPAATLAAGILLTAFTAAGFSLSFILSGFWLDPLAPAGASAVGVMVSFLCISIIRGRYSRRFRLAYGPFVSRACLKSVIRAGSPIPSQTVTVRSAMVAVKNSASSRDDTPAIRSRAVLSFQKNAAEMFKKAGAAIIGMESDMVTACFGSPLERVFLGGRRKISPYEDNIYARSVPAERAVEIVSEIAKNPECEPWRFGLDLGNCTFAWTALTGYFAMGDAVFRARMLSRLTGRYNTRAIISASVNEALPDLAVKKLDTLKKKDGSAGDPFYNLPV